MPHSDTYIEKEAQINEEIDRLRHACTQAILTRNDVIIVASVSAIYNIGSPKEYENIVLHLEKGQPLDRRGMLERLIGMQFERTNGELKRGSFRMRGQIFDIMPTHEQMVYRFEISVGRLLPCVRRGMAITQSNGYLFVNAWDFRVISSRPG